MNQKQRERYQLERFKAVFKDFPEGEIIDGADDGTEPDFFVASPKALLGIELTELYRQAEANKPPMQAGERIRKQIVDRALNIFEKSGGPSLDVSVHFGLNEDLRKDRVADLAAKLANVISAHLNHFGEYTHTWLQNPWTNKDVFPFEIDLISVMRIAGKTPSHWSCPESSCIPEFSEIDIQKAIDKKEDRIASYRHREPQAIWLLVIRGLGMSSTFDLAAHATQHNYVFGFDRVFLFDWFSQTYVEMSKRGEPL
jgi:hypothetical protein